MKNSKGINYKEVQSDSRKNESKNTPRHTQGNSQKIQNWKMQGHDVRKVILVLKNSFPSMTDWPTKWIDVYKKKTQPNRWKQKRPAGSKETSKKKRLWQLQTHKVPTADMQNTNGTDLVGDLQFSNKLRIFPEEKRCHKWTRGRVDILYID